MKKGQIGAVLRALFSRKWGWVTLVVLVGMGIFLRLGIWQLDRLAERRAENVVLAEAMAASPLVLTAVSLPPEPTSLKDRAVVVSGTYDLDQQLALKVQNWNGMAGIHLIAPLVAESGETAVLIDRGWIPDSDAAPDRWAHYDETGPITVAGYVALSQTVSRPAANPIPNQPQREWYRVDVAAIQAQLPYTLLPVYVIQSPPPEGNSQPPLREPRQVALSEGNHFSYALQWFLFSLILAGGYLVYVNKSVSQQAQQNG
jgi:surfeit locus 1 family protein